MTNIQFTTMDDGCSIAWQLEGPENAEVLLLSSSLGTSMGMWNPQMAALTSRYQVLRYDSRGHGQSDSPAGSYSMDRLGRDAIALLDMLGLEKAHFCGLSMGGMVRQWLAVRAPERLSRLVLANTSAYMGPPSAWQSRIQGVLANGMEPLTEASIARWFTPSFPNASPDQVSFIRQMLLVNYPAGYAGCCAAIRDMDQRPTAHLNRTPTLVIAGGQDPATSVAEGQFLSDSATDGRLVVLPAAHLSNVEVPEAFTEAVVEFLEAE